MTGNEYLYLTEGDLCRLTEDVETNGVIWKKGDILEVVYRNRYEETICVRNISVNYRKRHPYKTLGVMFFLKAIEVYKKWKDRKTDTIVTKFEHKFMPGDTFWIMEDNKPKSYKVFKLSFDVYEGFTRIMYSTKDNDTFDIDREKEMFATKDELLDSLR